MAAAIKCSVEENSGVKFGADRQMDQVFLDAVYANDAAVTLQLTGWLTVLPISKYTYWLVVLISQERRLHYSLIC